MDTLLKNNHKYSNGNGYTVLIFFIWPFLSFLIACANFKDKLNQIIILAFFCLYGFLTVLNPVMDIQRRADHLKEIGKQPIEDLYKIFDNLYDKSVDIVEPILIFTVSRFTDFHGVLFMLYALIFGSLMIYYLRIMYAHYKANKNLNTLIFFILLICINPINEINGFRMWTAAWIYAVGVLNYLHKPKLSHLLLAISSVLVHFSFIPLVILLMLYILLKGRTKVYGVLAITSFFIAELNIQSIRQYAALFGSASETKITAYTNEEYIETVAELNNQGATYIQFIEKGLLYFTILSLTIIYYKTKGRFNNTITSKFYSYTLLTLSFANISSLLPSGFRFYKVFYIFAFSTLLLYYAYECTTNKITNLNRIGLPIILLFTILTFRLFSDTASVYLFGPSFFIPFAFDENLSLQSILF